MGRLIDGKWVTTDLGADAQGNYVRRVTQFRNRVAAETEGDDNDDVKIFPVESGRYRLIVGSACGWSHRCLLIRALKGLEDAIPVTFVEPFMGENGWTFKDQSLTGDMLYRDAADDDQEKKKNLQVKALHQLYVLAKPDYTGRASVPVLWDSQEGTIVNNESSDLVAMFLQGFESLATKQSGDLQPADQKEDIQAMMDANYGPINNGVYKCGFAGSQEAYTTAATALFERLEYLEDLLGRQRYLVASKHGQQQSQVSLADLCLFPTLFRFDAVYYTHFKCNKRHLYEMPNLWAFTREIYQFPGVKETCRMDEIKEHYFTSHESIHPRRYIPIGPANLDFDEPHGRGNREYES